MCILYLVSLYLSMNDDVFTLTYNYILFIMLLVNLSKMIIWIVLPVSVKHIVLKTFYIICDRLKDSCLYTYIIFKCDECDIYTSIFEICFLHIYKTKWKHLCSGMSIAVSRLKALSWWMSSLLVETAFLKILQIDLFDDWG